MVSNSILSQIKFSRNFYEQHFSIVTNINHSASILLLYIINVTSQIFDRLMPSNYLYWHARFDALLIDYELQGLHPYASSIITNVTTSTATTISHNHWIWQEKLVLYAICFLYFIWNQTIYTQSHIYHEPWKKLIYLYASKSLTRVLQL